MNLDDAEGVARRLGVPASAREVGAAAAALSRVLDALESTLPLADAGNETGESDGIGPAAPRASSPAWPPPLPAEVRADAEVERVVDMVERALAAVHDGDGAINAFLALDPDAARAGARAAPSGPLHGVPVGVKDLFDVRGFRTTAGSRVLDPAPAGRDAAVVRRLRDLGAIVLGKTNLHEFAFGVTGVNPHHGAVRNPRGPDRIAGGSSSGSAAAVAAGFCPLGIGTDTGGSIRIPAALCGVVGFKPSFGALPLDGVVPLSPSLDHVGICGRSVRDVTLAHAGLAGVPLEAGRGWRIGVLDEWIEAAEREVGGPVRRALRALGRGFEVDSRSLGIDGPVYAASSVVMLAEAAEVHLEWLRTRLDAYGEDVRFRLLQGMLVPAWALKAAARVRRGALRVVGEGLGSVDVLVGPTVPVTAPPLERASDPAVSAALVRFTRLANLLGLPAVSLPVPAPGLPVGLQVVGRAGDDGLVLGVAAAIEQALAGVGGARDGEA